MCLCVRACMCFWSNGVGVCIRCRPVCQSADALCGQGLRIKALSSIGSLTNRKWFPNHGGKMSESRWYFDTRRAEFVLLILAGNQFLSAAFEAEPSNECFFCLFFFFFALARSEFLG